MNSSADSPEDFLAGCGCIACHSLLPHGESECPYPGVWWIEIHLVDNCESVEGGATRAVVCKWCFASLVAGAEAIVSWSMLGVRSSVCGGCEKPLTRLSHIVTDVAKIS